MDSLLFLPRDVVLNFPAPALTMSLTLKGPCTVEPLYNGHLCKEVETRVNVWIFCPPGCKKVAVVERWPLAEVQLYSQVTHFYGHPLNTDTSLLRTVCFVPGEREPLRFLYI